ESGNYGFERSDMYESKLAGSVEQYERHLFLCYKSHESFSPLALKARKEDIKLKTRLTICEAGDNGKLSNGDVLIFPEMIVYRGLIESEVDRFVEDVLVNENVKLSGKIENLNRRCGVCGPILIEKFKKEIGSKDLKKHVSVTACSHVGGHKYAGNVIIFSATSHGKIAGNWNGYVTPGDIHELLDKQIGQGEAIDRIWRTAAAHLMDHFAIPVRLETCLNRAKWVLMSKEEPNLTNGTNVKRNEKQPEEIVAASASTGGCCRGADGFSCCKDENVEKKPVNKGLFSWIGK
ncbi:hypothetical protein MIMGU_mgv1a026371mg, partial [Erythranthe guttata]